MYKKLRTLLVILSMLGLAFLSSWYIKNYENSMLGNVREVVAVDKSKISIIHDLKNIAKEKKVIIAKQISVSVNDDHGSRENTFEVLGKGNFPSNLKEQKNRQIIQASPNDVLYLIIGKGFTASELSKKLNSLGNQTEVWKNDWTFSLVANAIKPTLAIGLLIILSTYATLLLADFIEQIRKIGIYRLAGESKHFLAFKRILYEGAMIFSSMLILLSGSLIYSLTQRIMTLQIFQLISVTFLSWALLLFVSSTLLSLLFYYVLQHQPINLSIKGKAPLRTVVGVVIAFQAFSVLALMFSFTLLQSTNQQERLLEEGTSAWAKNKQYFGLTPVRLTHPDYANMEGFLTEVLDNPDTLLVQNQFNNQTLKSSGGYLPSPNVDENLLYVNANYLKKEQLSISSKLKNKIEHLNAGQYAVLVPESQANQSKEIFSAWKKWMNGWNQSDIKVPINFEQINGEYRDNHSLFAFSIKGPSQVSNKNYATSPLLIVYGPATFAKSDLFHIIFETLIPQIMVKNTGETAKLISKYHLENAIGSFNNGYSASLSRKSEVTGQQNYAIVTNILSLISSILLISLLNTIYLYQNRRKFLIERLAGKTFIRIHQNYAYLVALSTCIVVALALFVLHLPIVALWVVLGYLLLLSFIFGIQINQGRRLNVLYLKGE